MADRPCLRVLVGLAIAAVAPDAGAQAPPPGAAATQTQVEAEARAHFKKGNQHFDNQEWLEALGEFRKARALKRTRAAMVDEASCLKQLGRYDEALDAYEALRREFPVLPPRLESRVAPAIEALRGLVGSLVLAGDAPDGASVFVDGRLRGRLPLPGPLRVGVGSHAVRVEKERFEPIVATVDIDADRRTTAELRATTRKGRLAVSEKHNWVLEVEVDGKGVGVTPWEGLVEPGDHKITLTGFVGLDTLAEYTAPDVTPGEKPAAGPKGAKMGSPTVTAPVRLYEVTPVTLTAEEVDASLRIESTPGGASLSIDSRLVGHTPWEGRLGLGVHTLELTTAGFFPAKQQVRLVRRKQRELQVALEREPDTLGLRRARSVGAGVGYGVGALGLGVFAVAGGLALAKTNALRAACPGGGCYLDQQPNLDKASALGTAATVGLVVGGLGVAAGTVVVLAVRPRARSRQPAGPSLDAGLGLGRLAVEGRF